MVDVSGIPNMGFGGGGYFGGSASLGLPAMSADQINASMGWNPNAAQYDPWANTPGGFGGQTDYYSSLGAAYGRETGGFSGGYGGGYPSGTVERGPDLPNLSYDPFGGGGIAPGATYDSSTGRYGGGSAPAYDWGSYFSGITGGQQSNPYTGVGAGYDYYNPSSYGLGASWGAPSQPSYSSLGYDPSIFGGGFQSAPGAMFDPSFYGGGGAGATYDSSTGRYSSGGSPQPDYSWSGNFYGAYGGGGIGDYGMGAGYGGFNNPAYQPQDFSSMWSGVPAYDPGSFANRFGDWGSNSGSPSQYYTGSQYGGGGQMPPGFAGLYGADNQSGALPLSGKYGYVNSNSPFGF